MFGSMYFDRQGQPITRDEWAHLLSDMGYKRVAADTIWWKERYSRFHVLDVLITVWRVLWNRPVRKNEVWVSTVWLGLDHGYRATVPIIFETKVFADDVPLWDDFEERYSTEEEARQAHESIVACIRAGGSPERWWKNNPHREDTI